MEYWYKCPKCGWTGSEKELAFEAVEGCSGDDKLEICPNCGAQEVYINHSEQGTF